MKAFGAVPCSEAEIVQRTVIDATWHAGTQPSGCVSGAAAYHANPAVSIVELAAADHGTNAFISV